MDKTKKKHQRTEWLWGIHAVREAWTNPKRVIHSLLVTDRSVKDVKMFIAPKNASRPRPDIVERRVIDKRLPIGAVHQNIAVECDATEEVFLSDIIIQSKMKEKMTVVMLDQVTDPHNVGAILRSSCAFGASALIVQTRHAPDMTGTLAKAACGAVEYVPIVRETNLSRSIAQLQDAGFIVIGLDEAGKNITDIPAGHKICLVMGAEGSGLRQKIKETCTILWRLPTDGPVPTLNVSNATAVALYAIGFTLNTGSFVK